MIISNTDDTFSIDCTFQEGHLYIGVSGQLIMANAALVRSLLSGDAALRADMVTIDLSDVHRIDDAGLSSVTTPVSRLRSQGHTPVVRLPLHSGTRSVVRASSLVGASN